MDHDLQQHQKSASATEESMVWAGVRTTLVGKGLLRATIVATALILSLLLITPILNSYSSLSLGYFADTLMVSAISLGVAIPIGLLSALYLSLWASPKERQSLLFFHDQLARVPMVVWAWGALEFAHYFMPLGHGMAFAGITVGLMVLPTFAILAEKSLSHLPLALRRSALALGASDLAIAFKLLIPAAKLPILGAILLILTRSIGEIVIITTVATALPLGDGPAFETLTQGLLLAQSPGQMLVLAVFLWVFTTSCEFFGRRLLLEIEGRRS